MTRPKILLSAALVAWAFLPFSANGAFTIQFDYSYDADDFFLNGSVKRDLLESAANFFEGIIGDDLDAITPSGGNSWMINFQDPTTGIPGQTVFNPSIPSDTLVVYVGARDLGGNTLGQAGPGGWNAGGSAAWLEGIRQRGEAGSTQSTQSVDATDFAPWGGVLSMDLDTTWDYSLDGGTLGAGEFHFYSVLLHEIGHILGVGTSDSWDANVSGGQFVGSASVASYGGNVPLETDYGHWSADLDPVTNGDQVITSNIFGTGTSQEVALDPTIGPNTVKLFTELDVAALQDIGWEIVTPVPEPSSGVLLAFAAIALGARRRR